MRIEWLVDSDFTRLDAEHAAGLHIDDLRALTRPGVWERIHGIGREGGLAAGDKPRPTGSDQGEGLGLVATYARSALWVLARCHYWHGESRACGPTA